jgi:hypothetical protein
MPSELRVDGGEGVLYIVRYGATTLVRDEPPPDVGVG